MATKLRMPFFAAVAAGQTSVFVFNLINGSRQTVDISALGDPDGLADNRINYVELFRDHVLLAGSHSISAWHRTKGTVGLFPPRSPSVVINASPALLANAPGYWRGYGRRPAKWSAVHHDGANLVAVSHGVRLPQDGRLMWTVRPGRAEDGALQVAPRRTAVLRLHATCVQLAVENGKAVVATVHADLFCALWLVDLTNPAEEGTLRPAAPVSGVGTRSRWHVRFADEAWFSAAEAAVLPPAVRGEPLAGRNDGGPDLLPRHRRARARRPVPRRVRAPARARVRVPACMGVVSRELDSQIRCCLLRRVDPGRACVAGTRWTGWSCRPRRGAG